MTIIPGHFLFRISHPCAYQRVMPRKSGDDLLDLPESCRLQNLAEMSERKNFADVRLAWNEFGIGFQVEVKGKEEPCQSDTARPQASDGVAFWIDTRGARTSHRGTRYCHLFYFLPSGSGPDRDQPCFVQMKINRALQDAPFCSQSA